jgi:uncharacterized protein (TIGR02246 family)
VEPSIDAAVRAAVAAYAQALDDGRPDDIAELFCPDGVAEITGTATLEGRAAIRAGYAAWAPVKPQLHLVANTVIAAPAGDTVAATSDVVFFQYGAQGWAPRLVGRYADTLHLDGGVWRFHRRVTTFRPSPA